jgi:hypothetical protein
MPARLWRGTYQISYFGSLFLLMTQNRLSVKMYYMEGNKGSEQNIPKPEVYRWIHRGDDSAVERLEGASEASLLEAITHPRESSRGQLLGALFQNYSGKAFGDFQWQKASGGWTTPEVPTVYGDFRTKYNNFAQLSLDPGFVTHVQEFMGLADSVGSESVTYEDARAELEDRLGDEIVWRGMYLTEEEAADIANQGILSPFTEYLPTSKSPVKELEVNLLSTKSSEIVEHHFHGEHPHSPFISVSTHKDVAISVGRHFGKKTEGRAFYLFKLKIPNIDLIHYTETGIKMPSKLQSMSDPKLRVSVNGDETLYDWDEKVESFVYLKINPDEILEITQPDITESGWNNRITK